MSDHNTIDGQSADPASPKRELPDNVVPARPPSGHRLRDAIRRARMADVERSDVIVDLREAEIARLQLLQDALGDVIDEVPDDSDLFDFQIQTGTTPRLWIDVLAHVIMGRDKRTYRLVQETRHGRQTVLETTDLDSMTARVTDYVARRVIERERALASDQIIANTAADTHKTSPAPMAAPAPRKGRRFGWLSVIVSFLFGISVGAVALFSGTLWVMGY